LLPGDERDHGLEPLFPWVKFLRVKKCSRRSCPNFREDNDISENNADSDWRNPGNIYTTSASFITSLFSEVTLCSSTQEGRCRACLGDCIVSFHFPDGYPDIFFFALLQGTETTERTLQETYQLGPYRYRLYAYSLYHSATGNVDNDTEESDKRSEKAKVNNDQHQSVSHYTSVFFDDGRRIIYNDIKGSLSSRQNQKLSSTPVVSVWLIREDKM